MAEAIYMPALGQTTDEVRILTWYKSEGDSIKRGEVLLEVQTDKAVLEVESAAAGVVLKIIYAVDDLVPAGKPIAYVGEAGEQVPVEVEPSTIAPPSKVMEPLPVAPVKSTPVARRAAEVHDVPLEQVSGTGVGGRIEKDDVLAAINNTEQPTDGIRRKVLARPTARLLAQENDIDITMVRGSGPNGLIEKADVQAVIDGRESSQPSQVVQHIEPQPIAPQDPTRNGLIPVPRYREVVAQRLTQSVQTIPQFSLMTPINMVQAQGLLKAQRAGGLTDLTYTHLTLRVAAQVLGQFSALNSLWVGEDSNPMLRQLEVPNVGLAVASGDRLLVPTVPDPARYGLTELARVVSSIIERARHGTLNQADMAPAALSVSNLGMHLVEDFQAIIDPAQTAILAVGRIVDTAIVVDGGIKIAPIMKVRLSVDHRVVDGTLAAQFLTEFRLALENIEV